MRIAATILLETIVSSLIFLIVFFIALESINKINRAGHPDWSAVERAINERRDSTSFYSEGCHEFEYPWGTLVLEKQMERNGLMSITITSSVNDYNNIVYRYLYDE